MSSPFASRVEDAAAEPADSQPRQLPGFSRQRVAVGVLLVLVAAAVLLAGQSWDMDAFHAWTKRLPAAGVAWLVAVLPLVGFPVSALHLAAGLRFDFWMALAIVAAATLTQHVAAWGLARALPDRCFARLEPWRKKLAGAGHRQAAVLCCLLPGMPYAVQLYLLPVMGAPLRVLCLISAPLHSTRATVTILLGSISDDLSPGRVTALVAYYLTVFTVCGFALRRLRRALAAAKTDTPAETG